MVYAYAYNSYYRYNKDQGQYPSTGPNGTKEFIFDSMGCEESLICCSSKTSSSRMKATSIKSRLHRARRPETKRNIDLNDSVSHQITEDDWDMVEGILLNHQLLFRARGYANKEIMNRLECFEANPNQVIFKKGDPSNYFYIIIQGKLEVSEWAEGEGSKTISRGDCFGDMGIYNKARRSATVTALETTCLLGLKKENFLRFSLELSKRAQNQVFLQIKNIPIFKTLNIHQKHKIAYLSQQLKFKTGGSIFKKGEISNCLYIVKSGKVLIKIQDRESIEVKPRESFGQSCLSETNASRKASAMCLEPTILLAFSKRDISKYIGKELFDVEIINKFIWAVRQDKNLKVSPLVMESMIELKEVRLFSDGDIIFERGSPIKHFLISLEGGINSRPELEVFNTDFLFDIRFHTEKLVKRGAGRVAFINIEAIESRFNRNFNNLIDLNKTIWRQIESVNKIQDYVASLTLDHFRVIDTRGLGDYGCTLKVRSESNIEFAMRVVDKVKVLQNDMEEQVATLRIVGGKLTHPLIAKQYRIFSDKYRIFFMSRWVEGQDLYDLMDRQKKLSARITKHFAACIISIMEYMHCRRIIWRELKIQSFMIDPQGYLTLTDLMHLEELPQDQASVSTPSKATFLYLSPEVLTSQGHGFETDFWSLGVIIYRMIVGEFPYGQKASEDEDVMLEDLSSQIQNKELYLPNWLTSDVKILLKMLLHPHPFERSLISFPKLKTLTFFKDYDWLGLIEKKVKIIPYLPKRVISKCLEPIHVSNWIEHQQSELPPPSILDDFSEPSRTKTSIK